MKYILSTKNKNFQNNFKKVLSSKRRQSEANRSVVLKIIKDVQKSGDPKKIAKLKMELERLAAVGGKDKIVPNEGIVFTYKGGTYKLTGTFASLNQILGLFYS
jgi:hypothetical protein